jgi:hypothetical protein
VGIEEKILEGFEGNASIYKKKTWISSFPHQSTTAALLKQLITLTDRSMAESKTYTGGCHCGANKYSVPLSDVTSKDTKRLSISNQCKPPHH